MGALSPRCFHRMESREKFIHELFRVKAIVLAFTHFAPRLAGSLSRYVPTILSALAYIRKQGWHQGLLLLISSSVLKVALRYHIRIQKTYRGTDITVKLYFFFHMNIYLN